jgi:hypothetical protein
MQITLFSRVYGISTLSLEYLIFVGMGFQVVWKEEHVACLHLETHTQTQVKVHHHHME